MSSHHSLTNKSWGIALTVLQTDSTSLLHIEVPSLPCDDRTPTLVEDWSLSDHSQIPTWLANGCVETEKRCHIYNTSKIGAVQESSAYIETNKTTLVCSRKCASHVFWHWRTIISHASQSPNFLLRDEVVAVHLHGETLRVGAVVLVKGRWRARGDEGLGTTPSTAGS